MELMAAIEGLKALKRKSDVVIYTDSVYLRDGITKWIINWKKNNWRTANKKEVKNKDLWTSLEDIISTHVIEWRWVKGHVGNEGNEKADELATRAILERKATGS